MHNLYLGRLEFKHKLCALSSRKTRNGLEINPGVSADARPFCTFRLSGGHAIKHSSPPSLHTQISQIGFSRAR